MERVIHPNIQYLLEAFMGDLNVYLPKLETKLESELIELFRKLNITSSVKSDKYSLPHNGEVIVKLNYESYIAGVTERTRIFRPIVKEMLELDTYKIRFYVHIDGYGSDDTKTPFNMLRSGLTYTFKYFIH